MKWGASRGASREFQGRFEAASRDLTFVKASESIGAFKGLEGGLKGAEGLKEA